jgi:hypothetical protein
MEGALERGLTTKQALLAEASRWGGRAASLIKSYSIWAKGRS